MLLLPQVQGRGFRLGLTDHTASHMLQESLTQAAQQPSLPVYHLFLFPQKERGYFSPKSSQKSEKKNISMKKLHIH